VLDLAGVDVIAVAIICKLAENIIAAYELR
jgi:hypothetical protein